MEKRPLTDNLPDYETARRFLRILEGEKYSVYVAMMNDIFGQIGNPKEQVDWKNPDEWIPLRLKGEKQELAFSLWLGSEQLINPRHSAGFRAFSDYHQLALYSQDSFELTENGERFINRDDAIIRAIDEYEGLLFILYEIMENGPCKRLDLIESFTTFCHNYTTWKAHSSISSALSARIRHLRERELIERLGHTYQTTQAGITYLQHHFRGDSKGKRSGLTIHKLVADNNNAVKKQLREFLQSMNPFRFEHLIGLLLEAMGYDKVEVTSGSNDKGVDVVADIELGISRVREIIQVKRHKGNIGRPVLDGLRGSLFHFNAVRGTIITTGGFTKGTKDAAFLQGAPPITLIDGEKLIDLLIQNEIGIRKNKIEKWEFDEEQLQRFESQSEI